MVQVTDSEYTAFIVSHLGHIDVTGQLGAIQWVNTNDPGPEKQVLATKRQQQGRIVYHILANA
jgi:hypothetical protein